MTASPAPHAIDPQQALALARLRQRFVAGLAGRWTLITSLEAAVRDQALHQLAGAAGAYGFDALGSAARRAEHCAAAGDVPGLAQALASLHELMHERLEDLLPDVQPDLLPDLRQAATPPSQAQPAGEPHATEPPL